MSNLEKNNKPLISVIVPIYNVEKYVEHCIKSLLNQDYDNYEIILVDDCSTDDGLKIVKKYSEIEPKKCKVIQREKNGGLSAARNTGLKEARGEWITFVDSDDWVADNYLSSLYEVAYFDDADIVMGNVYYAYSCNDFCLAKAFGDLKNGAENKEIIAICRSYACGRLFRTSLFLKTKIIFPEDIKRSEDIGTIIPILTQANKISLIETPIYFYFQRSDSISNSNTNIDLSFYIKTLKRMFELSKKGFEHELEFRAIHEMLYGMVFLMIESHKTIYEFRNHIDAFIRYFPDWKKNKYISWLPKEKQIFIFMAGNKNYIVLKLLISVRKILKRMGIIKNAFRTKN